jgi:urease accessory protein
VNTVWVSPDVSRLTTPAASGTARLKFSRVGSETILERSFATSPVKVFTTRNFGGACWVYSASLGGGFVGGDTVRMTLEVGRDSVALLATQASTKVYRSLKPASQSISASIHEDALLTVLPDPVVCFAGADFSQEQRYDVAGRGSLVVVDWITSGRHAMGERWAFNRYRSRIDIFRDGRRVFFDSLTLQHETDSVAERMGRFDVCATCVLTGARVSDGAAKILQSVSQLPIRTHAATIESACPLAGGTLLRVAGTNVEEVGKLLRARLAFLHPLLGDDPWSRKW